MNDFERLWYWIKSVFDQWCDWIDGDKEPEKHRGYQPKPSPNKQENKQPPNKGSSVVPSEPKENLKKSHGFQRYTKKALNHMTKKDIDELAEDVFGVKLDRRIRKDKLIEAFMKAQRDFLR